MSKRFRNIFILFIVLLLLMGANLIVHITVNNTYESIVYDEINYISNNSVETVTQIEIENKHGKLVLVSENGIWYIDDDRTVVLDQGVVSEAVYMLAHIVGERKVSDDEDYTNLYGMITPAATITIYHDRMLKQNFKIGDKAPIENEYYFHSSAFKEVYTVDSAYYVYADATAEDFMVLNSINIEHADMETIKIVNTLGEQFAIRRTADDNNISLCYWEFAEPFNHDADTAVLYGTEKYEGMISIITQLAGESILGYVDRDSDEYGQSNPVFTAEIYGASNQYQRFAIGDYGDANNYSISFSDDNMIYMVSKDRVPFINYSLFFITDANLNLINIDSVEGISIDLPDLKTEIDVERYIVKNEDGTDYTDANGNVVYQVEINVSGVDENTKNISNIYEQKILFYQYLTSIKIDDLLIGEIDTGDYIGNIMFELQSVYREVYSIEFYEYSKSHYIAKKNGEDAAYLVNISYIEKLAKRYDLLKTGQLN